MGLFKKKRRAVGKGTEQTVSFHKGFEVLNYSPVDYKYTGKYVNFLEGAEKRFRKAIEHTNIDDLCGPMFDYYIDANVDEMKTVANEQYTYHVEVISQHKGLVDGEIDKAKGHLVNLDEDLKYLNEQIAFYQQLKRDRKVY